jgi:hypothetical protein
LYIILFSSKCASRHNGVHFFDISISKVIRNGPNMRCFAHFDLEMCFAPEWRALFRHLNLQKWSDVGVFYTFWLLNVLRTTTACMRVRMWRFLAAHFDDVRCARCMVRFVASGASKIVPWLWAENSPMAFVSQWFGRIWCPLASSSNQFNHVQCHFFPNIPTGVTGPIFSIDFF